MLVCLRVGAVEHLDVVEHVLSCSVACEVGSPLDPLAFQQVEEAFCDRVVMAITTTAHPGIIKCPSSGFFWTKRGLTYE